MVKGSDITVELLKIYKIFSDQINVSADLALLLHSVRDIKASGNEIEGAIRLILKELLPRKCNVSQGHIIDSTLSVSKQYDIIMAENIEYTKVIGTADGTELFMFENIYGVGEIKASWNLKNFKDTVKSIRDIKTRLKRESVSNKTIFTGVHNVEVVEPVSSNPYRNPLFNFAFAVKSDGNLRPHRKLFEDRKNWAYLPNLTIILNEGIFVLLNSKRLKDSLNVINLYPEFALDNLDFEWKFISIKDSAKNLAFLIFCLLEHLSSTLLTKPSFMIYTDALLGINDSQIFNLNEL